MTTKQEIQNLYTQLVKNIILGSKELQSQDPALEFKTAEKLILKVKNKRSDFKILLEAQLKKQKVPYQTKVVGGSSFEATIADFKKSFPTLKPLTIQYKESGGGDKPPKVKTAWQERGASYIFEQALVKTINYSNKLDQALSKLKVKNLISLDIVL